MNCLPQKVDKVSNRLKYVVVFLLRIREENSRRQEEDFRRLIYEVRAKNGLPARRIDRILKQMDPERFS